CGRQSPATPLHCSAARREPRLFPLSSPPALAIPLSAQPHVVSPAPSPSPRRLDTNPLTAQPQAMSSAPPLGRQAAPPIPPTTQPHDRVPSLPNDLPRRRIAPPFPLRRLRGGGPAPQTSLRRTVAAPPDFALDRLRVRGA
ncbi:hypothetical protein chiPu_0030133, partial [Chiloscyllium punctatum]|nr:hypothetical protein [Chiloscyllium punctatum]